MMVQTEWLSTDGTGWEISPIFAHRNAAKQTVRRPRKRKEKALKPSGFKAFPMAGAEGLEPSARGFGVAVEKMKHTANPPLLQPFGYTQRRVDALLMLLSVPRIPPYAFGSFIPSTSGAMLISY